MTFEKTKASAAANSVAQIEEDLNEEEDTSTDDGQSVENDAGNEGDTSKNDGQGNTDGSEGQHEEKVTLTKAEYDRIVSDRENYKQGMLSEKAKKRTLTEGESKKTVVEDEQQQQDEVVDVNEETVLKVLSKQKEREALKNTINSKHNDFIPELIDDNQYNEIVGFLPRNVDKNSYESIVKGLKLATKLWKEDRGIVDKVVKKQTDLHTTKNTTVNSGKTEVKQNSGRKLLKGGTSANNWYH